jgi:hypothetical protein
LVGHTRLGDLDVDHLFPGPEWDVAPGSRERVVEHERDVFGDRNRTVRFDDDFDLGVGEIERLGVRRCRSEKREQRRQDGDEADRSMAPDSLQKRTSGA